MSPEVALPLRPQPQRPAEQAGGQNRRHDRVEQAQLFEVQQALLTRDHFGLHGRAEALLLAEGHAERTHERHVADHVDELAVDRRRFRRKVVMPRRAAFREPVQDQRENHRRGHQAGGHQRIDGDDHHDRAQHRDARRQDVPRHHVFGRVDRVRCGRDPAREHAGLLLGEVRRRMAGEIREQILAQVAGDDHEHVRADPAADPPQQVVGGDQPDEDHERAPERAGMAAALSEDIDQMLDRVLRGEGAADRGEHAEEHDGMRDGMPADVAHQKRERTMRIARKLRVVRVTLGDGELVQWSFLVVERLSVCCAFGQPSSALGLRHVLRRPIRRDRRQTGDAAPSPSLNCSQYRGEATRLRAYDVRRDVAIRTSQRRG